MMCQLELRLLLCCCLFGLIDGLAGGAVSKSAWELPTTEQMQDSLQSCQLKAAGEDAVMLRCLVEQLGLWTDEQGYNAKRIAKIFAAHRQMEELMLVIEYCNNRERREEQPAQWALEAYKCATSGRFGRWVKDYVKQRQSYK
ncbi:uncharacterized protein LOC117790034 [Drosophila innubila]|uniref:uncharacterized protein LOC117790034 n=1 Tax=Drosophila innubila TaxID=198719 RepID=UPI00148D11CD|nr:uncharacterized protein LOC117790034 [Drosophila innubila]